MVSIDQSGLDVLRAGKTMPAKKENKYKSVAKTVDGILFHSTKEANRYSELKLMQHVGIISNLNIQVPYVLLDDFVYKGKKEKGIKYFADFEYYKEGKLVTEDTKGERTRHYIDKRKMLLSRYPAINFIET